MSCHLYNYIGPSMHPTLRVGDGLIVLPYEARPIKKGDMVVFTSPQDGKQVVHRVVKVNENGIQTRGDNNRLPDPYFLQSTDIIGQVIEVQRGDRRLKKFNGLIGEKLAEYHRSRNRLWRFVYRILSIPYQKIAPLRLPLIKADHLKVATFHKNGGEQQALMLGRRVIGWRRSQEGAWMIRAPYRYFIRENVEF
ncbi:signal peptidase I [candidate division KSB1 bacterium]|nr:signal peptidase I [candidate division KSB1 bacterium]